MHRFVRITGIAATGLAAALVMSGCSSSDSKSSDASKDQGKGSNTAAPASSGGSGADGAGAKAADIEGSWLAMTGGKSTALVIQGKQAAIAGQHVCTGTVAPMGKPMLALKCPDGNNDRTMGSIESADGKTMTVSWEAGIKDTFKKTDGAKLPDGLKMPK
ncbi:MULTISPECIES: hypothetical protein [unclassified Streptomyces]|uniref:hypothetical protein n=1 Tax=unclassified Streptomyces TaxID=2593676 RepID=UPI002E0E89A1|nr:hypothetical protein OG452_15060 [Streptomyces sp. NBC_01197]WSS50773.1 hypothetical protein OG708_20360 [Streptomyces sp. NBC_01180]